MSVIRSRYLLSQKVGLITRIPSPRRLPCQRLHLEVFYSTVSIVLFFSSSFSSRRNGCTDYRTVKALYDYTATIDEEFDFQAGDVIAVTATPEDGWWSGVLLDEARREEGRHIFPSNFVTLF
jgi:hypothetical protein